MGETADHSIERVAIVGAGAMGLMLAALIGRCAQTIVVCRDPARAEMLRHDGARATGELNATSTIEVTSSITTLADHAPIDALFIATKTTAISAVATELKPALPAPTATPGGAPPARSPTGTEPGRPLIALLDHQRLLRMVLNVGATLPPGADEVRVTFHAPPHAVGVLEEQNKPVALALADLLTRCDFPTEFVRDIETRVWAKGIVNAAVNPVAAITDSTVREVMASPARLVVQKLLEEGLAVARAEQHALGDDFIDRTMTFLTTAGPHVPSMVEDIRNGRESEVGQLNRQIIHHGSRLGVQTPTHRMINALIEAFDWRVYERSRRA